MAGGWIRRSDALTDIARNLRAQAAHDDPSNLRKHGRLRPGDVWCSHGAVLDLSAGGIRLLSKRAIGGDQVIRLQSLTDGLTLGARVVWIQKLGFRKHEVGLEFFDIDDRSRSIIRRIATP